MRRLGSLLLLLFFCTTLQAQKISEKVAGMEKFSGFFPFLLGRESRKDLARDRQVEYRVSLRRIAARRHRLERHRSRSRSTRQQLDRPFRSHWTTRVAGRAELQLPRDQ
jgi:hypothetical protein